MKTNKLKSIIIGTILSSLLCGCTSSKYEVAPEQHNKDINITIKKGEENNTVNFKALSVFKVDLNTDNEIGFYRNFTKIILMSKEVAYYGKAKGYKYFSYKRIASEGIDNTKMQPFTDINSHLEYCFSDLSVKDKGCYGETYISQQVIYFTEKQENIPTWNIEEIINEKIDLSSFEKDKHYNKSNSNTYKGYLKTLDVETL